MQILKAKVEKLLITRPFGQSSEAVDKMEVLLDGIKYDRHFGKTRNSDVRVGKLLPRGIETTNLRMVTIVSEEELNEISAELGVKVLAEDMEANITLSGVKSLTKLPPGTFIRFPRSLILYITAENFPCVIVSQNIIKRDVDKMKALKFVKAAMGKRGLTAMTYASGVIKVGDEVEIIVPQILE